MISLLPPRRMAIMAVVLSLVVPGAVAKLPGPPAVIVQDFENRSYEIRHDWVGIGLAYLVRKNLTAIGGLHMLEDRRAKPGDLEPLADYIIDGEVRLDTAAGSEETFVVFVTLDRLSAEAVRLQFLTEGTLDEMFDMAGYLTERIARHLDITITADLRARLGRGMTEDLTAFQQFAEAIVERRIHVKMETYERAVLLDPDFAEAYFHLGRVHTVLRNYEEAEQPLRRSIELVPDFAEAHNDLAYVLAQQGKVQEARVEYEAATRSDPNEPRYWLNLGDLLRVQGAATAARAAYEKAREIVPEDAEAIAGLNELAVPIARATPPPSATPKPTPVAPRPTPTPRVAASPAPTQVTATPRPTPPPATPVPQTPTPTKTPVAADAAVAASGGQVTDKDRHELDLARRGLRRARGDRARFESMLDRAEAALGAGGRVSFYSQLGDLYAQQKLKHAAVDAFRTAFELAPDDAGVRERLASAYEKIGKRKDAATLRGEPGS